MKTIKDAIQRIKWRFENGRFIPNENDCKAINIIIDWVNKDLKEFSKDNVLLVKCYTHLLNYETMKYQNVKFASRKLNQRLHKINIEQALDQFKDYLNLLEYQEFLKNKGLKINHPAEMTDEEKKNELEIIKIHQKEFLKITVDGKWTSQEIKIAVINQLTNLIKLNNL